MVEALLASIALLIIPILHDRGSLKGIGRAVAQVRFGFVMSIAQCLLLLLLALVNTISANVKGCGKDATKDSHAELEGYLDKLPTLCRNKRALSAFLWLAMSQFHLLFSESLKLSFS